jgi:hypothetical protein
MGSVNDHWLKYLEIPTPSNFIAHRVLNLTCYITCLKINGFLLIRIQMTKKVLPSGKSTRLVILWVPPSST